MSQIEIEFIKILKQQGANSSFCLQSSKLPNNYQDLINQVRYIKVTGVTPFFTYFTRFTYDPSNNSVSK
jgi:hypothetical protein